MSSVLYLHVEIVRDPVITTLTNNQGKEESVVMFVGKVTAPAEEVSGKNIVFFYTKETEKLIKIILPDLLNYLEMVESGEIIEKRLEKNFLLMKK